MTSMTVAYTGKDIGYQRSNVTLMSYLHDYAPKKKNDIFYVSNVLLIDTNRIQNYYFFIQMRIFNSIIMRITTPLTWLYFKFTVSNIYLINIRKTFKYHIYMYIKNLITIFQSGKLTEALIM